MKTFDPDLMTSVVTNFIDNAVKASEEDSRIVITATKEKLNGVPITVTIDDCGALEDMDSTM